SFHYHSPLTIHHSPLTNCNLYNSPDYLAGGSPFSKPLIVLDLAGAGRNETPRHEDCRGAGTLRVPSAANGMLTSLAAEERNHAAVAPGNRGRGLDRLGVDALGQRRRWATAAQLAWTTTESRRRGA